MGSESAFAFETVTVPSGNVVATLRRGTYDRPSSLPCRKAMVTVNPGAPISYMVATGTVTSAGGHQVAAFGSFIVEGLENIMNFQTTSYSSGTAGSISVTYYR